MPPTISPSELGIRHTGSWEGTDLTPADYRQGLLYLYPNGALQLTALMSMARSAKPKAPDFFWYTKNLPTQSGTLEDDGVYTDNALSSAYSAGTNTAGKILYVKTDEDTAKQFRAGHTALLQNPSDHRDNTHVSIQAVTLNGDASVITTKTLVATGSGASDPDPAAATEIIVIGSAQEENGTMPDEVNYNPVKMDNKTQIFWTPYSASNTQIASDLDRDIYDVLSEERREKFELHGIELEKAFIFGEKHEETVGGKPKRYTQGLVQMIKEHASDRVYDYKNSTDTDFASKPWTDAGSDFLDEKLEEIFLYGGDTKICMCGRGFMTGLNQLAKIYGTIQLNVREAAFGIKVVEWITVHGRLLLRPHPLFNYIDAWNHMGVIFEAKNIEERPLRNMHRTKDNTANSGGHESVDGIKEGWRTETGLLFKHPYTFAVMYGIGEDNVN